MSAGLPQHTRPHSCATIQWSRVLRPSTRIPTGRGSPSTSGFPLLDDSCQRERDFPAAAPGSRRILAEYKMLDEDFSVPCQVPQPSASCLLLRRSCLPADHVLDERYPIYFNDVQLARSLADKGLELWATPDAVVTHEAHASGDLLDARGARRLYLASLIRMLDGTESKPKVALYRGVVLIQNVGLLVLRRPGAFGFRELRRVLAGDPGALPACPGKPRVIR